MSSTLILNANTASPVTVVCQRAGKGVPRRVGSKTYSFAGAERSSVRGQAKVIPITTSYVDTATEALIQNAGYNGAALPCSGDILGNIQTVCSFENVVSNMMPGLPGFFEMSFTLNEVQASVVLLKYAPGDTITGEVFTRSTSSGYRDSTGLVATAAINVKRDANYDITDLIPNSPSLLLEDTRTNIAVSLRDLTNAAWIKTNVTAAHTSIGADGTAASATRLTATAGNGTVTQAVTLGSSSRSMTAFVRRITGTGTIEMTTDGGGTWTAITVTAGYTRLQIPAQTVTNPNFGFRIGTNADAIDVDFVDDETGLFPSSPVSGTRGADLYSLPFTTPPSEMTVYLKFIERGTILTTNAAQLLIASAGSAAPLFAIYAPSGLYTAIHSTATINATSAVAVAPVYNDTVELCARLFGDGSVDITQSINGGAATSGAQSIPNPLAAAWSGLLAWPNSASGGVRGFTAIKGIKIVAGCRSLSEMRVA